MSSYERMSDEYVQEVSPDTSPALTSNSQQPAMASTDLQSHLEDDSMSAASLPSSGSGDTISSEDLESRRTIDSDPAAILPSRDLSGVELMDDVDLSASTTDVQSQEFAPGNEMVETQPNDQSYRVPPPELPLYPPPAAIPVTDNLEQLFVTEEVAREAFLKYAKRKLFYSTAPATQMKLPDLSPSNIFRYTLETFAESRFCCWKERPYHGEGVDGPENGDPPYPWDIAVEPPEMFTRGKYQTELPHTSLVQACWRCSGFGEIMCSHCSGRGRRACISCGGLGWIGGRLCLACSGSGLSRCLVCSGSGLRTCDLCFGAKQLLKYIELNVSWEVFTAAPVTGPETEIPEKKLKKVTGKPIFREERVLVPPIKDFPDDSVNKTSQKIMREHLAHVTSCRILGQKQTLELLPVTKVGFTWREKECDFFVFGIENKVYAGRYPQKCCCAIM